MDYFTAIPNTLLDDWLPQLTDTELRVMLYVLRRTVGYHQPEAAISLRLMQTATGITHRGRLATAVDHLIALGLLQATRPGAGQAATLYAPVVTQRNQSGDEVSPVVVTERNQSVVTAGNQVVTPPRLRVVTPGHPLNKETKEAGPSPEEEATWLDAQETLRGQMSARNWELRIAGLRLVRHAGGLWYIQAPTHAQHGELCSRWGRLVERALGTAVGYAIKVRFVPPGQAATG